jgi:diguanylate cyclase (GGDEF)-like protein
MATLIILLFLTGFLFFSLERLLEQVFLREADWLVGLQAEHRTLTEETARLKQERGRLQEALAETVAMYELAKDVSKTLDEAEVFGAFKERLAQFIRFSDCRLLGRDAVLSKYRHYSVIPLEIDAKPIAYLAVSGIEQDSQDTFLILAHQFMLGAKRAFLYQRIQELAIIDSLTGAFTRSYYLGRFDEELARSQRFNYKLSYLAVDIDHFKDINDKYGHLVGDVVLRRVSGLIKEKIRQIDSLGRRGGDEFLVSLPETDALGAAQAAERIRQAIEDKAIKAYDEELKATVSIGVATFPEHGSDNPVLLENADKALYQAKQQGRNRVAVFQAKH